MSNKYKQFHSMIAFCVSDFTPENYMCFCWVFFLTLLQSTPMSWMIIFSIWSLSHSCCIYIPPQHRVYGFHILRKNSWLLVEVIVIVISIVDWGVSIGIGCKEVRKERKSVLWLNMKFLLRVTKIAPKLPSLRKKETFFWEHWHDYAPN